MRGSENEARKYALKLFRYRPRSRKEMFQRLQRKGFSTDQINSSIEFLENIGLIQDNVLASELFHHALEKKFFGKKGIWVFLFRHGIEKGTINELVSGISKDTEEETALRLVKKKLNILRNYPQNIIKRRLWGMLQRRGFSNDTITMALEAIDKKI